MSRSKESLGWSASGQLSLGQPNAKVSLQQTLDTAHTFTVQFRVDSIDPARLPDAAHGAQRPQAVIAWTVEGNTVRRLIDVDNGVSVSGVAEAFTVTMFDAATNVGTNAGIRYGASMTVAPGTRPSQNRVPVYRADEGPQVIAPAGTALFKAPPDAGVISVEVATSTGVPANPPYVQVDQLNGVIGVLKTYDLSTSNNTEFVPSSPGLAQVRVVNKGAAAVTVTVSWGIDG